MKTVKRLSAIFTAILMIAMVLAPTAAFAAETVYTAIPGTTMDFNKYLTMNESATVPNATFSFAVTAGGAVEAGEGTLAVIAGPVADSAPSIADVTFAPSDTTTAGLPTDAEGSTTSGSKYATKTATVDFSGVTFTEPGVYRYVITESGTNQGVTNDATTTRTVDVYVQDNDGTLVVVGYVMYEGTVTTAPKADGTASDGLVKSTSYTNSYASQDLTFAKKVTGNQGSKDKYFAFTVNISGATAGTKYVVDLSNADATISPNPNAATTGITSAVTQPAELTVGEDGTVSQVYYLHHGQSVTVKGLATGTSYAVTEVAEDYTSTETIANDYPDPVSGTIAEAAIKTGYTNDRSGTVPTGIMMTIVPGIIIVAVAAGGLFMLGKKKEH